MDTPVNTPAMSRLSERLSGLTLIYCYVSVVICFLSLTPVNAQDAQVTLYAFPVILLPGAAYLLDLLVMERRGRLSLLLLLNLIFMSGGAILFWYGLRFDPAMPVARFAFTGLFLLSLPIALYIAWSPIQSLTVINCFDWMAVLLIIYLAMQKQGLAVLPVLMPALCAFSMALSFVTMIRIRLDRTGASGASVGNAGAGRLLFGVLLVLIAGAALLIGFAASGMLHGISEAVWGMVTALGAALRNLIGRLYHLLELAVLWLLQWLPTQEIEGEPAELASTEDTVAGPDLSAIEVPVWFYALLAALAAALLLLLLYRLRRIRMSKYAGRGGTDTDVQRTGGLKQAFLDWLKSIRAKLVLLYLYLKSRKTPAGLLLWCERHYRRSCPRRTGESGEAYLRRLASSPAGEAAADLLLNLAVLVEQMFYASHSESANCNNAELYRKLHRAGR